MNAEWANAERDLEARIKRLHSRVFTAAELSEFYSTWGYTIDSRDKDAKQQTALRPQDWAECDRGSLMRIAAATELLLKEQRKANRESAKLAKKLDKVLDLFEKVLVPVIAKAAREQMEERVRDD